MKTHTTIKKILFLATIAITAVAGNGYFTSQRTRAQEEPQVVMGNTLIVTSLTENNDGNCTVNHCTLREAILEANRLPDANAIWFSDPGTINVASGGLPTITGPIQLVGEAMSGGQVVLNGSNAGPGAIGIHFKANGNNMSINRMVINRFDGPGVKIEDSRDFGFGLSKIGTNTAGNTALPNGTGIVIVNSTNIGLSGNVVSGNSFDGIFVDGELSTDNYISGNKIGTNTAGTAALPNGLNGIVIRNASRTSVGAAGFTPFDNPNIPNIISGNVRNGIAITGETADNNVISGNIVGLNASATAKIKNGDHGIYVLNGPDQNKIGDYTFGIAAIAMYIAGNDKDGIRIEGPSTTENVIADNSIGLGINDVLLGNGSNGIHILGGASNNVIGSPHQNEGPQGSFDYDVNVIGGNVDGIRIEGATTTENEVYRAIVGLNFARNEKRPNNFNGLLIVNSSANTAQMNHFSGNNANGVALSGNDAGNNGFFENIIGLTGLGNGNSGVKIINSASNNQFGGGLLIAENVVEGNAHDGFSLEGGDRNRVAGNEIRNNGGLGIDIGAEGVNQNDPGDNDTGPNNLQNYPELSYVSSNSAGMAIAGTLNSRPNAKYWIMITTSNSCDPSGFGEGEKSIWEWPVTTNSSGVGMIAINDPTPFTVGSYITARAQDSEGNTSEFSQCKQVVAGAPGFLQFSTDNYSVNENGGTATITVTRNEGNVGPVSVAYATRDGNATAGQDYTARSGVLSWNNGDTNPKTFTIPITNDMIDENGETVFIEMTEPTGGARLRSPYFATLTINDDDDPQAGTVQFSAATYSVSENGTNATITVNRTGNTAIGVSYATSNGTATAGQDYTTRVGMLSWAAGDTAAKTFTIPITNDSTDENNETVNLTLSAPTGGTTLGTPSTSVLTITDDDDAPGTIQWSAATYSVNENAGNATVTVNRTGTAAIGVSYATSNGTAIAGQDYTTRTGTLSWAAGDTAAKTFTIPITNDSTDENNETVNLTLSAPTGGATLGTPSTAMLTIVDNDNPPEIVVADNQQNEGNSGTTAFNFNVSLSIASGKVVTVNWATSDFSANAPVDYQSASGQITFNPGELSKTITVQVVGNTIPENSDGFYIVYTSPVNAELPLTQAFGNILNDDGSVAVPFDYDGDRKADISVFRPSTGVWYIKNSSNSTYRIQQFGLGTDTIVPADYDGDGKYDIAIFRPSNGLWYWLRSSDGQIAGDQFGLAGDVPVPADYDGDGKTDVAIYRPSTGMWWIRRSSDGNPMAYQFGLQNDIPMRGDYDGDGKADLTLYRASTGVWYRMDSFAGNFVAFQFGQTGDWPMAADFDGDDIIDMAVFRPTTGSWYIAKTIGTGIVAMNFGLNGDIPVPAPYFSGFSNLMVFRPSNGTWYSLGGVETFGTAGDIPTPVVYMPRGGRFD